MPICYLNGSFVPLAGARVSVLDRGFIFGDGIYEVIPVFAGRPFRLAEHLDRLARSLEAVAIRDPYDRTRWIAVIAKLIADNSSPGLSIYIQVTRGASTRNHAAPNDVAPTVFAMASTLANIGNPVAAILIEDLRWQRCDIKAVSLLANVMARTAAQSAGAYEAILVRDGYLTEGAASNVFIVQGGRIKTPPKSSFILAGITREALLQVLMAGPDEVLETPITRNELLAADEIWVTSSTRDIVPVIALDGAPVGSGEVGAVYRRVNAVYTQFKTDELRNSSLRP